MPLTLNNRSSTSCYVEGQVGNSLVKRIFVYPPHTWLLLFCFRISPQASWINCSKFYTKFSCTPFSNNTQNIIKQKPYNNKLYRQCDSTQTQQASMTLITLPTQQGSCYNMTTNLHVTLKEDQDCQTHYFSNIPKYNKFIYLISTYFVWNIFDSINAVNKYS